MILKEEDIKEIKEALFYINKQVNALNLNSTELDIDCLNDDVISLSNSLEKILERKQ